MFLVQGFWNQRLLFLPLSAVVVVVYRVSCAKRFWCERLLLLCRSGIFFIFFVTTNLVGSRQNGVDILDWCRQESLTVRGVAPRISQPIIELMSGLAPVGNGWTCACWTTQHKTNMRKHTHKRWQRLSWACFVSKTWQILSLICSSLKLPPPAHPGDSGTCDQDRFERWGFAFFGVLMRACDWCFFQLGFFQALKNCADVWIEHLYNRIMSGAVTKRNAEKWRCRMFCSNWCYVMPT